MLDLKVILNKRSESVIKSALIRKASLVIELNTNKNEIDATFTGENVDLLKINSIHNNNTNLLILEHLQDFGLSTTAESNDLQNYKMATLVIDMDSDKFYYVEGEILHIDKALRLLA